MGYPMTFDRFVKRNGLADGDYGTPPHRWRFRLNVDSPGLATMEELRNAQWPEVGKEVKEGEARIATLAGDLRRLEQDATDESALCLHIASRTGLTADVVAAVLKEFIAW